VELSNAAGAIAAVIAAHLSALAPVWLVTARVPVLVFAPPARSSVALAAFRSPVLTSQSSINGVGKAHDPPSLPSPRSLPTKRLIATSLRLGVTAGALMFEVVPVAVAILSTGASVFALRSVLMPPRWRPELLNVNPWEAGSLVAATRQ
jgi:uncharacterized membrane protein